MKEVGEIRERAGLVEMLMETDSHGLERWESLAEVTIRHRYLEGTDEKPYPFTIEEQLRDAGWLSPADDLPVCGKHLVLKGTRYVCLLRVGHEGDHRERGVSWESQA